MHIPQIENLYNKDQINIEIEKLEAEDTLENQKEFVFFKWENLNNDYYGCLTPKGPVIISLYEGDKKDLKIELKIWDGKWRGMWYATVVTNIENISKEEKNKRKKDRIEDFKKVAGILFGNPNS